MIQCVVDHCGILVHVFFPSRSPISMITPCEIDRRHGALLKARTKWKTKVIFWRIFGLWLGPPFVILAVHRTCALWVNGSKSELRASATCGIAPSHGCCGNAQISAALFFALKAPKLRSATVLSQCQSCYPPWGLSRSSVVCLTLGWFDCLFVTLVWSLLFLYDCAYRSSFCQASFVCSCKPQLWELTKYTNTPMKMSEPSFSLAACPEHQLTEAACCL